MDDGDSNQNTSNDSFDDYSSDSRSNISQSRSPTNLSVRGSPSLSSSFQQLSPQEKMKQAGEASHQFVQNILLPILTKDLPNNSQQGSSGTATETSDSAAGTEQTHLSETDYFRSSLLPTPARKRGRRSKRDELLGEDNRELSETSKTPLDPKLAEMLAVTSRPMRGKYREGTYGWNGPSSSSIAASELILRIAAAKKFDKTGTGLSALPENMTVGEALAKLQHSNALKSKSILRSESTEDIFRSAKASRSKAKKPITPQKTTSELADEKLSKIIDDVITRRSNTPPPPTEAEIQQQLNFERTQQNMANRNLLAQNPPPWRGGSKTPRRRKPVELLNMGHLLQYDLLNINSDTQVMEQYLKYQAVEEQQEPIKSVPIQPQRTIKTPEPVFKAPKPYSRLRAPNKRKNQYQLLIENWEKAQESILANAAQESSTGPADNQVASSSSHNDHSSVQQTQPQPRLLKQDNPMDISLFDDFKGHDTMMNDQLSPIFYQNPEPAQDLNLNLNQVSIHAQHNDFNIASQMDNNGASQQNKQNSQSSYFGDDFLQDIFPDENQQINNFTPVSSLSVEQNFFDAYQDPSGINVDDFQHFFPGILTDEPSDFDNFDLNNPLTHDDSLFEQSFFDPQLSNSDAPGPSSTAAEKSDDDMGKVTHIPTTQPEVQIIHQKLEPQLTVNSYESRGMYLPENRHHGCIQYGDFMISRTPMSNLMPVNSNQNASTPQTLNLFGQPICHTPMATNWKTGEEVPVASIQFVPAERPAKSKIDETLEEIMEKIKIPKSTSKKKKNKKKKTSAIAKISTHFKSTKAKNQNLGKKEAKGKLKKNKERISKLKTRKSTTTTTCEIVKKVGKKKKNKSKTVSVLKLNQKLHQSTEKANESSSSLLQNDSSQPNKMKKMKRKPGSIPNTSTILEKLEKMKNDSNAVFETKEVPALPIRKKKLKSILKKPMIMRSKNKGRKASRTKATTSKTKKKVRFQLPGEISEPRQIKDKPDRKSKPDENKKKAKNVWIKVFDLTKNTRRNEKTDVVAQHKNIRRNQEALNQQGVKLVETDISAGETLKIVKACEAVGLINTNNWSQFQSTSYCDPNCHQTAEVIDSKRTNFQNQPITNIKNDILSKILEMKINALKLKEKELSSSSPQVRNIEQTTIKLGKNVSFEVPKIFLHSEAVLRKVFNRSAILELSDETRKSLAKYLPPAKGKLEGLKAVHQAFTTENETAFTSLFETLKIGAANAKKDKSPSEKKKEKEIEHQRVLNEHQRKTQTVELAERLVSSRVRVLRTITKTKKEIRKMDKVEKDVKKRAKRVRILKKRARRRALMMLNEKVQIKRGVCMKIGEKRDYAPRSLPTVLTENIYRGTTLPEVAHDLDIFQPTKMKTVKEMKKKYKRLKKKYPDSMGVDISDSKFSDICHDVGIGNQYDRIAKQIKELRKEMKREIVIDPEAGIADMKKRVYEKAMGIYVDPTAKPKKEDKPKRKRAPPATPRVRKKANPPKPRKQNPKKTANGKSTGTV